MPELDDLKKLDPSQATGSSQEQKVDLQALAEKIVELLVREMEIERYRTRNNP